MKKIKMPLMLAAVLLALTTSCKKSSSTKSRSEYLTQGTWKLVKSETKIGANPYVDVTSSYSACEKDNQYIFNAPGTYQFNEGATKCSTTDPQIIEAGNWVFLNSESQIKTTPTGSSSSDVVNIEVLDDNSLVFTYTYTNGAGTITEKTTLGH